MAYTPTEADFQVLTLALQGLLKEEEDGIVRYRNVQADLRRRGFKGTPDLIDRILRDEKMHVEDLRNLLKQLMKRTI